MTSSRKLSTEEVSALIEGLDERGPQGSAPIDLAESVDVRPFSFGSDDLSVLGDYYALRMINERFARHSRATFLPMLRIQPRISSFPPEVKTFDEYCEGIEGFMSLTTVRIDELRGSMMMTMAPSFISILTNSYYGGNVISIDSKKSEFTATEERVIELVTNGLCRTLETSWRDLMRVNMHEIGREVNPQFASFVDGGDLVIICSFVVQLPNFDPATFDIIYPLQTLKPIASQLRSRVQSEIAEEDASWRDRLEHAVLSIPLHLSAQLGTPTVPLTKLIYLQPGDVVPMTLNDNVELFLEEQPFYEGEMGEVGGQAAINLLRRMELDA